MENTIVESISIEDYAKLIETDKIYRFKKYISILSNSFSSHSFDYFEELPNKYSFLRELVSKGMIDYQLIQKMYQQRFLQNLDISLLDIDFVFDDYQGDMSKNNIYQLQKIFEAIALEYIPDVTVVNEFDKPFQIEIPVSYVQNMCLNSNKLNQYRDLIDNYDKVKTLHSYVAEDFNYMQTRLNSSSLVNMNSYWEQIEYHSINNEFNVDSGLLPYKIEFNHSVNRIMKSDYTLREEYLSNIMPLIWAFYNLCLVLQANQEIINKFSDILENGLEVKHYKMPRELHNLYINDDIILLHNNLLKRFQVNIEENGSSYFFPEINKEAYFSTKNKIIYVYMKKNSDKTDIDNYFIGMPIFHEENLKIGDFIQISYLNGTHVEGKKFNITIILNNDEKVSILLKAYIPNNELALLKRYDAFSDAINNYLELKDTDMLIEAENIIKYILTTKYEQYAEEAYQPMQIAYLNDNLVKVNYRHLPYVKADLKYSNLNTASMGTSYTVKQKELKLISIKELIHLIVNGKIHERSINQAMNIVLDIVQYVFNELRDGILSGYTVANSEGIFGFFIKNTFFLLKKDEVFLAQHIEDNEIENSSLEYFINLSSNTNESVVIIENLIYETPNNNSQSNERQDGGRIIWKQLS